MWRFAFLSAVVAPSAFADPADRLIDQPPVALDAAANLGVTGVLCTRDPPNADHGCAPGSFDVAPSFGVDLGAGYKFSPELHVMAHLHVRSGFTLRGARLLIASADIGVRWQVNSGKALLIGIGPQVQVYGEGEDDEGDLGLGVFMRWEWTAENTAIGLQTIPNTWQSRYDHIRVFDLSAVAALRR
jgi:hypothetical protein